MAEHTARTERAIARVVEAVANKGRAPAYHEAAKFRLMKEWPTLATALHELVEAVRDETAD